MAAAFHRFCAGSVFLCLSSLASHSSRSSHFLLIWQQKQLWCLLLNSTVTHFFPENSGLNSNYLVEFYPLTPHGSIKPLFYYIFAWILGFLLGFEGALWVILANLSYEVFVLFQSISTPVSSCFPAGKLSKSWVNTEGRQDDRVYVIFQTWNSLRNYIVKLPAPV